MKTTQKFNQLDGFQKNEVLSEYAMRDILPKAKLQFTKEYEIYDAFIDHLSPVGEKLRSWFEIKIRNGAYNDYLLEDRKLQSLLKKRIVEEKRLGVRIKLYYLNFTPSGTYVWDLDKVLGVETQGTNYSQKTTAKASAKIQKACYYLSTKSAVRTFKYIIDKEEIIKTIELKEQESK
tara:strand:- start:4664 stop:5194 length:531 start_codon:yes stop_codon:yes gene_type:complete